MNSVVDLKELERLLDEALNKESEESLNEWLNNRITSELQPFIGDCSYDNSVNYGVYGFDDQMGCQAHYSTHYEEDLVTEEYTIAA